MSELRKECYKCLNNQSCPSLADYGSIVCMTHRKFEMPVNKENDSVYAIKFATLQKQIDEKDKKIDLSAEFIKNNMSEKKIINEICIKGKCNNEECHEDDLKECIKLHFEKLAKEKGE